MAGDRPGFGVDGAGAANCLNSVINSAPKTKGLPLFFAQIHDVAAQQRVFMGLVLPLIFLYSLNILLTERSRP
jgi:hypothetical protein